MNEETVFAEAIAIESPEERSQYLDAACGDNHELRQAVEELLQMAAGAGSFLEHPAVEAVAGAVEEIAGQVDATVLHDKGSTLEDDDRTIHSQSFNIRQDNHDDEIPLGYLEPSSDPNSLGRLGHYEVLEVIGRGAFGIVLRAYDEKLQRVVAIKVLAPELAATSPARKRFKREATSSASVRHENVVAVHAVEDKPIPYLVMEYIPGKTLQQRLDETGPLDILDVLRVGKQIADGLAAAHAEGLIHRDIKPGNILLEGGVEERVKITDFGLARTADDASMTQSGMIAGTPMYMAPEQAHGHKLDCRADLFSLGSVLYQMLSGRPPFRAPTTMAVLKRVTDDTPRPIQEIIPEVPEWMCDLVSHLHAKEPGHRYESAKEVSDLLARCSVDLQEGRIPQIPVPEGAKDAHAAKALAEKASLSRGASLGGPMWKVAAAILIVLGLLGISEATNLTDLSGIVIRLATGSGTLVIETNDPGVKIAINGEEVTITGGGVESITLRPGDYTVTASKNGQAVKQELVSIERNGRTVVRMSLEPARAIVNTEDSNSGDGWHGWPADAPPPAIAPFDADQAKAHQEAWAKFLGVPVEYENSIGMKFRLIPPGEFLMGSTPEEIEAALEVAYEEFNWQEMIQNEAPQHAVILTQPLYVGVTEVTQSQYEQIMAANPSHFSATGEGKDAIANVETGNHPVETVSWDDAAEFCAKLSQQEQLSPFYFRSGETLSFNIVKGTGYRLPTEAEWESACRAGTTTRFWSGNEDQDLIQAGWFGGNSGGRTHAAGELKANPFGLSDVHGNVWEWVQDSWDPTFYGKFKENAAIDPFSPILAGSLRVFRGGRWGDSPLYCRSALRAAGPSSRRNFSIGFRVVLPVAAVQQRKHENQLPTDVRQFASGEWIDLISLIDPEQDKWDLQSTGTNEWTIENGELLVGDDDTKPHKLNFPLDSDWDSFEIEIDVTRRESNIGFCFNIPTERNDCPVCIGWSEKEGVWIGKHGPHDHVVEQRLLKTGVRSKLRFEFLRGKENEDQLAVWHNDEPVGRWTGNAAQGALGKDQGYPHQRRSGLYIGEGKEEEVKAKYTFHSLRVRMLEGGTAKTVRPVPMTFQWPADAPPPAVAPFDAEQAKAQ